MGSSCLFTKNIRHDNRKRVAHHASADLEEAGPFRRNGGHRRSRDKRLSLPVEHLFWNGSNESATHERAALARPYKLFRRQSEQKRQEITI